MHRCHGASGGFKSFPIPPFEEERKKYETFYMPDSCSPSVYHYKVRPKANWSKSRQKMQVAQDSMLHFSPARSAKRASRFEIEFSSDDLDRSFCFQQQSVYDTCHRSLGVFSSTGPAFSSTKWGQMTRVWFDRHWFEAAKFNERCQETQT